MVKITIEFEVEKDILLPIDDWNGSLDYFLEYKLPCNIVMDLKDDLENIECWCDLQKKWYKVHCYLD